MCIEKESQITSGCTGKEKFTHGIAIQIAKKMNANNVVVNAYLCKFCHGYHVGRTMTRKYRHS
jgi:hypothetical protein